MLPFRTIGTATTYTDIAGVPKTLDYVNIHHRNEVLAGIGDAQLLVHGATTALGLLVSARAGVSIPLGKVQPDPFELGERGVPHEHIQFGTGTFDPVVGADAMRRFEGWSLAAFANNQFPFYTGSRGYRAGGRYVAGLVASSAFGLAETSFRLGLTGFHESAERWHGVVPLDDGNQGRTDLYVAPGATFPLFGEWNASVDLRFRVFGNAVGAQLTDPLIVGLSAGRLFHLEDDMAEVHSPSGGDVEDTVAAGELVPLVPATGKWTVFDFWATWCEGCKVLDARLRDLAAGDPRVAIRRVNVVDLDSPIAKREIPRTNVLPHVRVVAPDGTTAFEASGTADELMEGLTRLLPRAE